MTTHGDRQRSLQADLECAHTAATIASTELAEAQTAKIAAAEAVDAEAANSSGPGVGNSVASLPTPAAGSVRPFLSTTGPPRPLRAPPACLLL